MKFIRFLDGDRPGASPVDAISEVYPSDRGGTHIRWADGGLDSIRVDADYDTVLARIEDGDLDEPFRVLHGTEGASEGAD